MLTAQNPSAQATHNPMDISEILNPSHGAAASVSNHTMEIDSDQTSEDTTVFYRTTGRSKLVPDVVVPWDHQSTQNYSLPAMKTTPSQALPPVFSHRHDNVLPHHGVFSTPPLPLSTRTTPPLRRHTSSPLFQLAQLTLPKTHQDRQLLDPSSTASLSPSHRTQEETKARLSPWDIPLHHHLRKSPQFEKSRLPPLLFLEHQPQHHRNPRNNSPDRQRKPSFSNSPYDDEEVHWIRYQREDCGESWQNMLVLWNQQFGTKRLTVQCLSSRYYRDNKIPALDECGKPILDRNGKAVMIPAKVRDRNTAEGKDIPFTFVEKHPYWALRYDWVSPAHKEKARNILAALDAPCEPSSKSHTFISCGGLKLIPGIEKKRYQRGIRMAPKAERYVKRKDKLENSPISSKI